MVFFQIKHLTHTILTISHIALTIWFCTLLCKKIRINESVGFILCGIVLGPLGVGIIHKTELINGLGHVGLMIFIFAVGLEMPFHRIKSLYKYIFGLGLAQLSITTFILYIFLNRFFYAETAIIIAIALSFSSTAIIVQTLSERNETTGQIGRKAFSILLFQDIIAILLFVYIGCRFTTQLPKEKMMIQAMLGVLALCGSSYILYQSSKKILSFYPSRSIILPFILFVIFFFSWITAISGISPELGPFVAGIVLATTKWRHHIGTDIHPFLSVFLPAFFINIGSELSVLPHIQSLPLIIGSILALLIIKTIAMMTSLSILKMQNKDRFSLSILIAGCSEFFLMIIPSIKKIIGQEMADEMFLIAISSMIMTPFFFSFAKSFFPSNIEKDKVVKMGSVIIVGFGKVGQSVAYILEKNFISFTVIDYKDSAVELSKTKGFPTLKADILDIDLLKKSNMNSSKICLLTFSKMSHASMVRNLRNIFPQLSLCAKVTSEIEAEKLVGLDTQIVFPESTQSGMQMASHTLRLLGFSEDHVQKMIHLRSEPRFIQS